MDWLWKAPRRLLDRALEEAVWATFLLFITPGVGVLIALNLDTQDWLLTYCIAIFLLAMASGGVYWATLTIPKVTTKDKLVFFDLGLLSQTASLGEMEVRIVAHVKNQAEFPLNLVLADASTELHIGRMVLSSGQAPCADEPMTIQAGLPGWWSDGPVTLQPELVASLRNRDVNGLFSATFHYGKSGKRNRTLTIKKRFVVTFPSQGEPRLRLWREVA